MTFTQSLRLDLQTAQDLRLGLLVTPLAKENIGEKVKRIRVQWMLLSKGAGIDVQRLPHQTFGFNEVALVGKHLRQGMKGDPIKWRVDPEPFAVNP